MAEKIQIDAGHDQSITALYNTPKESSIAWMAETLVLMIHGFPGHKSYHDDVFGTVDFVLGSRGYHTLRFDFRGCGESDGRAEDFTLAGANEDFQAVLYWARSKGYKRFIYIGEGIGATLAVLNMDLDVRVLVMCWPVLDPESFSKLGLGVGQVQEEDRQLGYITRNDHRIGIHFLKELEHLDLEYALKEVFAPTLILHGARDALVPVEQLDLARRFIPAKRIEITTFHDGQQGLLPLNHRKSMMFQIQQFVEKYV